MGLLLLALLACACLIAAAEARAATTLTIHAEFSPNKLGEPTNISAAAELESNSGGAPAALSALTFYAPAGMVLDVHGIATCTAAKLEAEGPSGCPSDSRAGFGSGVSVGEQTEEILREPFTLDFFLGPPEGNSLELLVYIEGTSPDAVQLVLKAKEVQAPKPYGIGFQVLVPPVATLPGAPDAAVESVALTFGAKGVAYYKTLQGKRKLVHVRGVVVPRACPRGGFPFEGIATLADGSTSTAKTAIPCPRATRRMAKR